MKRVEMRKTISKIITAKLASYNLMKPERDNPQVKEMMARTDAEIAVFVSVLDALNNDDVLLKLHL